MVGSRAALVGVEAVVELLIFFDLSLVTLSDETFSLFLPFLEAFFSSGFAML